MLPYRSAPISLLLLFAWTNPAAAHSGAVAIAVPMEGIVVDGDLSDWPRDASSYPMQFEIVMTRAPQPLAAGAVDIAAALRFGYDAAANALYVAVEVEDDSVVDKTDDKVSNTTQDGCELYLEIHHQEESVAPAFHALWGDSMYQEADWGSVAVQRTEQGHRYEWRVDIDLLGQGQIRLQGHRVLGFGIRLWDRDADDSLSFLDWGRSDADQQKFGNSAFLGDLLLQSPVHQSQLRGHLHWAGTDRGDHPATRTG